jgi:hypothetical protein
MSFAFGVMNMNRIATSLSLLLCAGCASMSRQINVSSDDAFVVEPREYVMVQGPNDKTWFSGHQLINIARRYAEEQKLGFDFEGTEKIVWVKPGGRVRADVYFSSRMGQPILHVAIDKYGKVIRHETGTAVCGTGRK